MPLISWINYDSQVLAFACIVECATIKEKGIAFLKENKGKEGVVTLKSGLQYKVLTKGSGKAHPQVGTPCECHYRGTSVEGRFYYILYMNLCLMYSFVKCIIII